MRPASCWRSVWGADPFPKGSRIDIFQGVTHVTFFFRPRACLHAELIYLPCWPDCANWLRYGIQPTSQTRPNPWPLRRKNHMTGSPRTWGGACSDPSMGPRTTWAETGEMQQPRHEEVAAFLAQHSGGTASDLEPLTGGAWSSAWAYRAGEEELVIRFGRERSWYETDRMAMAFSGPDLPVPQVREVGTTPTGLAYAISVRHHGQFLEDTPVERADAVAPTLTRLLVALHRVPAEAGPDGCPRQAAADGERRLSAV